MLQTGTARVEVEAIDPGTWGSDTLLASAGSNTTAGSVSRTRADGEGRYLQVGAYSSSHSAQQVQNRLVSAAQGAPVLVNPVERQGQRLYRVLIGPLSADINYEELVARVQAAGHPAPILVDYP